MLVSCVFSTHRAIGLSKECQVRMESDVDKDTMYADVYRRQGDYVVRTPHVVLVIQYEGETPWSFGVNWEVLCDFFGGPRIEQSPDTSEELASPVDRTKVFWLTLLHASSRRWSWSLFCEFACLETSEEQAKASMQALLTRGLAIGEMLQEWGSESPWVYALRSLEDEHRAPQVRRLGVEVMLGPYASKVTDEVRERVEHAFLNHWQIYDLDEVLPRFGEAFIQSLDVATLLEFSHHTTCLHLITELKTRMSIAELITHPEAGNDFKREVLSAAMDLRRSFVRMGPELVSSLHVHDAVWVSQVLIEGGWQKLWSEDWVTRLYEDWFEHGDQQFHEELHDAVCSLRTGTPPVDVSQAEILFKTLYARWFVDWEPARQDMIPENVVCQILCERAQPLDDALAWHHFFAHCERYHLHNIFEHRALEETQRLQLIDMICEEERIMHDLEFDSFLLNMLRDEFVVSSVACARLGHEDFDDLACKLLTHHDSGHFMQPVRGTNAFVLDHDYRQALQRAIKAYVRQVELCGVRKSAFTTLRGIGASLPASLAQEWVWPTIERWTRLVGEDKMSGAVSMNDEDERIGLLSLEHKD